MSVPYTFANLNGPIPLSELDANFAVLETTDGLSYTAPYNNSSSENLTEKLSQTISPLDFGAKGDGVTDDTSALNDCFSAANSNGLVVDGLGKSYKVTPGVVIDSYATSGVGYGANKAWFCITAACKNISIIGNTSFGNSFIGKWLCFDSVTITGDCRVSSWYCNYRGLNVSGTTWFGGDLPPTSNFFGFYYNTFDSCTFNYVICDQRYGPVNLNNWRECRWTNWWVKNTGYVGYSSGDNPAQSFHMNTMIGCEAFTGSGQGITAPDGNVYSMVIGDTLGNGVTCGGGNRLVGIYNESTVSGMYGPSWQIENIHLSGNTTTFGGKEIGYNIELSGEAAESGETRTIPWLYPSGSTSMGGDWSVLNSGGYPYCIQPGSGTTSMVVTNDSTEPTGLGKCVVATCSSGFAQILINSSPYTNSNNATLTSYAIMYKHISGDNPSIVVRDQGGASDLYGSNSTIPLANGWYLFIGKSWGYVYFTSANAFTIAIGAVQIGRGNGVLSPFTNQYYGKPMFDSSGGSSIFQDNYSALLGGTSLYSKSNAKTISASSSNNFFSVTLPSYSGTGIRISALYKTSSSSGGARIAYRNSIVNENGNNGLVEQNITNITGANMSLSFSISANTLTVVGSTSASVSENAYIALEILGPSNVLSFVTVL